LEQIPLEHNLSRLLLEQLKQRKRQLLTSQQQQPLLPTLSVSEEL
jgi:hypothetical protein